MVKKCIKCSKNAVMSGFCRSHFIDYFEKKIRKTIRKYSLIPRNSKIAVAVSGGKDSNALLYILHKFGYDVVGITVDANIGEYTEKNKENVKQICQKYNIPLVVLSYKEEFGYSLPQIQSKLQKKGIKYANCMVCGILRRSLLNSKAKKLGVDLIATGHNLDDEASAFIMNVFRNDQKLAIRQGPISGVKKNSKFVPRIKPLYLCLEDEVERYSKLMKFPTFYGLCPHSSTSFRREFKNMLDDFETNHPCTKYNIINFMMEMISPQKKDSKGSASTCEICDEPSSKEICKKCQIIISLNNESDEKIKKKKKKS